MNSEADEEQAARGAVRHELGHLPIAMERMRFGGMSVTYSATFAGRAPVIIRTNTNPAVFAKTSHNIAILAALGLPFPRVLAADLLCSRFSFAYLILEKIPGNDLRYELSAMTPAQMTKVATQIVGFQKAVGTGLPEGKGFGYVSVGETGPYPTWKAFLEADEESLLGDNATLLYKTRLIEAYQRNAPYFETVAPTCFLDDITTKNVIVETGELRGIIDFDTVCYGDPLLMVGLTAAAVVCDVGLNAVFYVDEVRRLWDLSPAQNQAADYYSALMTLQFLCRFQQKEMPAWKERMVFALKNRWLAE